MMFHDVHSLCAANSCNSTVHVIEIGANLYNNAIYLLLLYSTRPLIERITCCPPPPPRGTICCRQTNRTTNHLQIAKQACQKATSWHQSTREETGENKKHIKNCYVWFSRISSRQPQGLKKKKHTFKILGLVAAQCHGIVASAYSLKSILTVLYLHDCTWSVVY